MTDARQRAAAIFNVSERQLEVLEQLCTKGAPNAIIAKRLGIADSTVKFHIDQLTTILSAKNRTHLALLAVKHGLISLEAI